MENRVVTFLDGCLFVAVPSVAVRLMAPGAGVLGAIKGNIGAAAGYSGQPWSLRSPLWFFCRISGDQKKMPGVPQSEETSPLFCRTVPSNGPGLYSDCRNSPVTPKT